MDGLTTDDINGRSEAYNIKIIDLPHAVLRHFLKVVFSQFFWYFIQMMFRHCFIAQICILTAVCSCVYTTIVLLVDEAVKKVLKHQTGDQRWKSKMDRQYKYQKKWEQKDKKLSANIAQFEHHKPHKNRSDPDAPEG